MLCIIQKEQGVIKLLLISRYFEKMIDLKTIKLVAGSGFEPLTFGL